MRSSWFQERPAAPDALERFVSVEEPEQGQAGLILHMRRVPAACAS